jgi:hypothetical protein
VPQNFLEKEFKFYTRVMMRIIKVPVDRRVFYLALLLLSSFVAASDAQEMDDSKFVRPLAPADLLALLPGTPENWKLTASNGLEKLSVNLAPETFVTRQYLFVPPPPTDGVIIPPGPDKTIQLTLIDTGNDPTRFGAFNGFKIDNGPSSPSSGTTAYKNFMADGLQVVQYQKDSLCTINIAVSERILLFMRLDNVDDRTRDKWLKIINLPKLAQTCAQLPKVPLVTGMLTMQSIDELNPKVNSTSQFPYTTKADLQRTRKAGAAGAAGAR